MTARTRIHGGSGIGFLALIEVGLAVVAVLTAGLSFGAFFGGAGYLPVGLGAAVLAATLAVVGHERRWRPLSVVALAVACFVVFCVYAIFARTTGFGFPGSVTWRALGDGLWHSWGRLLSIGVPADVTAELLVGPAVLMYLAGFAAAWLVLNSRVALLPLLPALVVLVFGLMLAAGADGSQLPLAGAFLLISLLFLLLRANRVAAGDSDAEATVDAEQVGVDLPAQRWHATVGRVAFGVPVIVAVAMAAITIGFAPAVADDDDRVDPRVLVEQPVELTETLTPLVQVKQQLEATPPRQLFTVRLSTAAAGKVPVDRVRVDRVRVAALDAFDGALWTAAEPYVRTGTALPAGPRLDVAAIRVRAHVEVLADRLPTGPYLPIAAGRAAAARPVEMRGRAFGFARNSGVLVRAGSAVNGYTYDAVTELRPGDGLATAQTTSGLGALPYTQLPSSMPDQLSQLAFEISAGHATPYAQLRALEDYLRKLPYDPSARPGHSFGALTRVLPGASADDQRGYSEQYASAFAVLARRLGRPARVAVGYRLEPDSFDNGTFVVTTAHAHAWPEVEFAGYGWVAFEPTNVDRLATKRGSKKLGPGGEGPGQPEPLIQAGTAQVQVLGARSAGPGGGVAAAIGRRSAQVLTVVLLAALFALALVVAAKTARRARRRHTSSPTGRVTGAWYEVLDRLTERGIASRTSSTAAEVAQATATRLGMLPAHPVVALAPIFTSTVCAPAAPDDAVADRAWGLEAELRRALRAGSVAVRVRSLVDPRPLLPRRRVVGAGRRERP